MARKTYAALIAERTALEHELRATARRLAQTAKTAATAKAAAARTGHDTNAIHRRWEREDRALRAQYARLTTAHRRVENDLLTAPR